MKLRTATKESVEREFMAILNRWRRKYPAYLVRRMSSEIREARLELMRQDIGFLLRIVGKAMEKGSDR